MVNKMITEQRQMDNKGYIEFNYKHVFQSKSLSKSIRNSEGKEISFDSLKDKEDHLVFVKYMPFSRLKEAIESKYLYFSSPKDWEDTFEHLLPETIKVNNVDKDVKCTCFTMTDFGNEEGFWKLFRNNDSDPVLAITYDVKRLFDCLNKTGKNKKLNFYLHEVKYANRNEIIEDIYSLNSHDKELFDCLSIFSKKRIAFGHEQELRLFSVVEKKDISDTKINQYVNVDYSTDVIVSVTMPPLKPFGYGDIRYDDYVTIQDIHNLDLKHQLEKIKHEKRLNFKILQSALYINKTNEEIKNLAKDKYNLFDDTQFQDLKKL